MSEVKNYIAYSDEAGSINISEDVLAVVVASATTEVEGVHALHPMGGKAVSRAVKIVIDGDSVVIGVSIIAELGSPVGKVGAEIQKAVYEAVEAAIGVKPATVDVHISGVSLKKSK